MSFEGFFLLLTLKHGFYLYQVLQLSPVEFFSFGKFR